MYWLYPVIDSVLTFTTGRSQEWEIIYNGHPNFIYLCFFTLVIDFMISSKHVPSSSLKTIWWLFLSLFSLCTGLSVYYAISPAQCGGTDLQCAVCEGIWIKLNKEEVAPRRGGRPGWGESLPTALKFSVSHISALTQEVSLPQTLQVQRHER